MEDDEEEEVGHRTLVVGSASASGCLPIDQKFGCGVNWGLLKKISTANWWFLSRGFWVSVVNVREGRLSFVST